MKSSSRLLALVLAATVSAASLPAYADDTKPEQADGGVPEEARARYERGIQLYNEGDYDAALLELERAYKLAPSFRILYNLGKVYRQRKDYAGAVRTFERYLAEGGAEVPEDKKAEVERELSLLKSRVGRVDVKTTPGAEITIDDALVGTAPLKEPVLVNVGSRRIGVSLPGRVPVQRVVSVAGGDSVSVTLDVADTSAGGGGKDTGRDKDAKPARGEKSTATIAIAWSATAVLAGAAVAGGLLALDAKSELDDKLKGPLTPQERDDARDKVKQWALLSDVCTGGALVVGAFALYVTLKSPAPPAAPRTGLRAKAPGPSLRMGVGVNRIGFDGAF